MVLHTLIIVEIGVVVLIDVARRAGIAVHWADLHAVGPAVVDRYRTQYVRNQDVK